MLVTKEDETLEASIGMSVSFEKRGERERAESAQSSQRTIDGASSRGRTCDLSAATAAPPPLTRCRCRGRRCLQSSRAAPLLRRLAKKFPRSLPRSERANKAVGGKRPRVCKWLFSFVAGFESDKVQQSLLTHSVPNFQSKVKIFSK